MSEGKLIFSFLDGVNLAITEDQLAKGAIVKFGSGFEHLWVQCDSSALKLVSPEDVPEGIPSVEFTVKPETAKTKVQDEMKPETQSKKPKAVADVQSAWFDEALPQPPTTFHMGVAGEENIKLTKTQRRNRNRKLRKAMDKLEREATTQGSVISQIPDYTACDVIPVVEEYVPQFVQRSSPIQIISEESLYEFQSVRKQNFEYFQRINGKYVNIVEGLELYTDVFPEREQRKVLNTIYDIRDKGRAGFLRSRTYSEPRKWMKGKGRITIQFGCCYNYALDKDGNPPGIIRHEDVDPIPPILKDMIKKMVAWQVLSPEVVPDSCIVNIYDEGDCIPPHIDSHDFVRPFCTVSLLSECNIMFGTTLRIEAPGEFSGPVSVPLPVGSVLIFKGNGADLSKHCVPAVPQPRVSITFRKMDIRKLPYNFKMETDLVGLRPLDL